MKILHIHQDYPDGRQYPNTKAVSNLIAASEKYRQDIEHIVLSINRTSNPFKISIRRFDQGFSLVYWALPVRFLYKPAIYFWAWVIMFFLRNDSFDAIHGHKLTTEGMFSYFLSCRRKVPYYISVRGGSDLHNIDRLADCIDIFQLVFKNAEKIYWVSPWAKDKIQAILNYKHPSSIALPNICKIDLTECEQHTPKLRYCIVLSYHQLKRKGLIPLLNAVSSLKNKGTIIYLDIIGTGDKKYREIIEKEIKKLYLEGQVEIIGKLAHNELLAFLKNSKGLLLPAINETFGMVYIEALACGAPIIYVVNTGIDGHINDVTAGVKINNQTHGAIAKALLELENNAQKYQESINEINKSNYLCKFTGEHIGKYYITSLIGVSSW